MARLVVVVGIPPQVEGEFGTAFAKLASRETLEPTVLSVLGVEQSYTEDYTTAVYDKLAYKLKGRGDVSRESLLADTNLIVLFIEKRDGSDAVVFDRFGLEAFVAPLQVPDIISKPVDTKGQRRQVAREVIQVARRAIRHAGQMLQAIQDELGNRENKTCLLLPPKTFGSEFNVVRQRVWDAATACEDTTTFAKSLRTLGVARHGTYYKGQGGLVYKAPSKAGPRHGIAPVWGDDDHEPSCIIRGRLRFGAPYNPRFHYDCQLPSDWRRRFPGCHRPLRLPSRRRHANCAPNDNVR